MAFNVVWLDRSNKLLELVVERDEAFDYFRVRPPSQACGCCDLSAIIFGLNPVERLLAGEWITVDTGRRYKDVNGKGNPESILVDGDSSGPVAASLRHKYFTRRVHLSPHHS